MSIKSKLVSESSSTKTRIRSSAGDVNGEITTVYNIFINILQLYYPQIVLRAVRDPAVK